MKADEMRYRSSRRSVVAALFAGVVLIGAAGCGVEAGSDATAVGSGAPVTGGSSSPSETAPTSTVVLNEGSFEGTGGSVFLRQAAEATSEVTTQKMAMTMTMTGMPVVGDVEITYEGEFDNEAGRGHMTVDMGDLMGMMSDGSPDSGRMELVIDGETVYVRSDLYASFSDGKPWVTLSADGASLDDAGVGVQQDPAAFLDFLEGVGDELETVGREELRGVPTTHVRTDIDMAALMAEASDAERAEMEESLSGMGAAEAFGSVPVEAWVDDDGYVRRFTMTFDMSGLTEEAGAEVGPISMTMDIELYDFNEPVTIEVPDPSQVHELDVWGQPGG